MGFRKGLYYLTQLAVSRGKNCILGFRLKPHWFHQKLHTRIMDETTLVSNCILGFRMKPKWFQIYRDFYSVQKLEYAIFCETSVVSSKIRVCNLKPVWFHPESEYAIFVKPFWFHQKSEYAINQCRRRFFGLMAPPWYRVPQKVFPRSCELTPMAGWGPATFFVLATLFRTPADLWYMIHF